MAGLTPFQTVGPFFHLALTPAREPMARAEDGTPIAIAGRLIDGAGAGIAEGLLEFWAAGYDRIGRAWTDDTGAYRLEATRPPACPDGDGGVHAPHFALRVLARGVLTQYVTRVYFDDAPENAADPILALVPAHRRATLVAKATGANSYRFDIVVQGPGETVFFDL